MRKREWSDREIERERERERESGEMEGIHICLSALRTNRQTMVCESGRRETDWPPFALLIGHHFVSPPLPPRRPRRAIYTVGKIGPH